MLTTRTPTIRARRYFDWARKQVALAELAPASPCRAVHMALADHYLHFAERELVAAMRAKLRKLAAEP
jgi:hypothetical protein